MAEQRGRGDQINDHQQHQQENPAFLVEATATNTWPR